MPTPLSDQIRKHRQWQDFWQPLLILIFALLSVILFGSLVYIIINNGQELSGKEFGILFLKFGVPSAVCVAISMELKFINPYR